MFFFVYSLIKTVNIIWFLFKTWNLKNVYLTRRSHGIKLHDCKGHVPRRPFLGICIQKLHYKRKSEVEYHFAVELLEYFQTMDWSTTGKKCFLQSLDKCKKWMHHYVISNLFAMFFFFVYSLIKTVNIIWICLKHEI